MQPESNVVQALASLLPQLTLLLACRLDTVLEGLASDHFNTVYLNSYKWQDGYAVRAILPGLNTEVCRASRSGSKSKATHASLPTANSA